MDEAIKETQRRRTIQEAFNKEHNITPKTIVKEIRDVISNYEQKDKLETEEKMTAKDKKAYIENIEKEMKKAASELDFERAMTLRDLLFELQSE